MVAIGEGAKSTIRSQIAALGTNVLIILPGSNVQGGVRAGRRCHPLAHEGTVGALEGDDPTAGRVVDVEELAVTDRGAIEQPIVELRADGDVGWRIEASLVAVAGDGEPTRYLGGLLVIDDEVVLLAFEGPVGAVRRVVDHARLPVGRILRVAYAPWPFSPTDEEK